MRKIVTATLFLLSVSLPVSAQAQSGIESNASGLLGWRLNTIPRDAHILVFTHDSDPKAVMNEFREWAKHTTDIKVTLQATQFQYVGGLWVLTVYYHVNNR